MVGKAFCVLSLIAVSLSLLLLSSSPTNAQGPPNKLELIYTSTLYDTTVGAHPDNSTLLAINLPDGQFDKIITLTSSPATTLPMGGDIALGAQVGTLTSKTTLSLLNGACYSAVTVVIPLMNSSTDITDAVAWAPMGTHDRDMNGNGLPDYVDKYPAWLLDPYDPDGAGPLQPLIPRARYTGHSEVSNGATPTTVTFLIFNPEQLSLLPEPQRSFGDTLGYGNSVILNNPGGEVGPTTTSDFCVPLLSDTFLQGESNGVMWVYDDETVPDATLLPFEWSAGGFCDGIYKGVDDDGDGVIDDGCLYTPDPCGGGGADLGCDEVRTTNPPINTGVYADNVRTSTHLYGSYYQTQRDLDWDGIGNNLDPCPLHVDNDADTVADNLFQLSNPYDTSPWDPWLLYGDANYVGDADHDRLATACDPNDDAGTGLDKDQDDDGYENGQDNCPLVPNGTAGSAQIDQDLPPGVAAPDNGPVNDGIGDACEPDFNGDTIVGYNAAKAGWTVECTAAWNAAHPNTACGTCPAGVCAPSGGATKLDWRTDPDRVDGAFLKDMVRVADCIGDIDTDGDGWCDTTEDELGSNDGTGASQGVSLVTPEDVRTLNVINCSVRYGVLKCRQPVCIDGADNDGDGSTDAADGGCSTPEHATMDVSVTGGTGIDPAPQSCSDGEDNDKDGQSDAAELDGPDTDAVTDCTNPLPGDTDSDGLSDTVAPKDNCKLCKNPDQTNTDADSPAKGDACDTEDDGDGWFDPAEWKKGTDPKNAASTPAGATTDDIDTDGFTDNAELFIGTDPGNKCADDCKTTKIDAANPLDMNNDGIVKGDDVLFYGGKLKKEQCQVGYSRRLDLNADAIVKGDDVLFFGGKLKVKCDAAC